MLPDEREILEFVRTTLRTAQSTASESDRFFFRDRFYHTLRVVSWVKRLTQTEPCDARLVTLAAIFHDVGYAPSHREDHPILSERICRSYLQTHAFPPSDIQSVCSMVRLHSNKSRPAHELTPELRVLMDADILDELGLTIIMWDSMDEGSHHQGDYYTVLYRVRRAYAKLSRLLPTLKTRSGHAEYTQGLLTLENAIKRLEYELHTDYLTPYLSEEAPLDSIARR